MSARAPAAPGREAVCPRFDLAVEDPLEDIFEQKKRGPVWAG